MTTPNQTPHLLLVRLLLLGALAFPACQQPVPPVSNSAAQAIGLACDNSSGEIFLRLPPGNRVQVLSAATRAVKREFTAENVPPGGVFVAPLPLAAARGADMAVRERDHHLFFTHPTAPSVIETDATGHFIQTISLANVRAAPNGLAYDQRGDRILIVTGGDLDRLTVHRADGSFIRAAGMSRTLHLTTLAFNSATDEVIAPLYGESSLGAFDFSGEMTRQLSVPTGKSPLTFDLDARGQPVFP